MFASGHSWQSRSTTVPQLSQVDNAAPIVDHPFAPSKLFHYLCVGKEREEGRTADDIADEHGQHELSDHLPPHPVTGENEQIGFHASSDDMRKSAHSDQPGHQCDNMKLGALGARH